MDFLAHVRIGVPTCAGGFENCFVTILHVDCYFFLRQAAWQLQYRPINGLRKKLPPQTVYEKWGGLAAPRRYTITEGREIYDSRVLCKGERDF